MTIDPVALEVEQVAWGRLRPHPANPRNGDVQGIKESVRLHGVYRPLVVADNYTVLAGNHLYAALGELGYQTVPVIRLPLPADSAEAMRIMLVDNRMSDRGEYDLGVLLGLLEDLEAVSGLVGTGYTPSDLTDLKSLIEEPLDLGDGVPDGDGKDVSGRRMLTLDFDSVTYATVMQMLTRARGTLGVDSNSLVVLTLLRDAVQEPAGGV